MSDQLPYEQPNTATTRSDGGLRQWLLGIFHPAKTEVERESDRLLRPGYPPAAPRQKRWPRRAERRHGRNVIA
jgi:hypothetical protein